ncbi:MAG: ThuA domain-containing protein [Gemmataceae bacterium]
MSICLLVGLIFSTVPHAGPPVAAKKIVLIAGKKSHGPEGNGIHDYGWSVRLLQAMLERSNVAADIRVEIHLNGWPDDPTTLDDADTLMIVSDGRDGQAGEEALHLATPQRIRQMGRLMQRGCGLVTFHFATFAPEQYRSKVLSWNGGYFQWEQDGKRDWYSAIRTLQAEVKLPTPKHPVTRGVAPFRIREEFYYNLRLTPQAVPLAEVPELKGRDGDGNVVAWALQRERGRGFGTTLGHFYHNWKNDNYRKLILNGLVWSAGVQVPENGVESSFLTHEQISKAEQTRRVGTPRSQPQVRQR